MSSESDGSSRPDDIVIIKQLLQKLEEAAARDAETPREIPVGPPVVAETTAEVVREEPPLLVLRSNRVGPAASSDTVENGAKSRPPSMPDLVRTPISIDLPSNDGALVALPTEAMPRRRRPGIAVALVSFVLGIIAAGGLIVAFDPFGPRGGPKVVRAPESKSPTAVAAAGEAAGASTGDTSARSGQISTPVATVVANADENRVEPARRDAGSGTDGSVASVVAANEGKSQEDARSVAKNGATAAGPEAPRERNNLDVAVPSVAPVANQSSPEADKIELRIARRVELRAGERRSMDIRVDGSADLVPRLLVVFRQVPGWMTFSKGGAIGNDIWLLPAPQVRDLEVEVSEGANGAADVKVQLARVDGSILSETAVTFAAVAQASAPVTAGGQPQLGNEATILRLQARGELLLDTGEVEAARTLLRTAAEAGSVAAALRLAETYDPAEIQRLGMGERSADVGQAVRWYEHAQALGSPVAAARLIALGRR